MKPTLLLASLLLSQTIAYGQQVEGEHVVTDTLNNTIALTLPEGMMSSRPSIVIGDRDGTVNVNVGYATADDAYQVNCTVWKNRPEAKWFSAGYDSTKSAFNFEYLDVLKDEIVEGNGKSYYILECKVKDGFLDPSGWLSFDDGSLYPSYFVLYSEVVGNATVSISTSYAGPAAEMNVYAERSRNIINTHKLLAE